MTDSRTAQQKFADFASQMSRNPERLAHLREMMEDAERRQQISERIRSSRERKAFTQPQVAKRVGVELRTYQNWEAGGGTSHENYELLAEILGVSFDYLLTGGDVGPVREDVLSRLDATEDRAAELREAVGALDGKLDRLLAQVAALASDVATMQAKPRGRKASRPQSSPRSAGSGND